MSARELAHDWFTLTVPGDVRVLALVRRAVESVAQLAGLSQKAAYESVLAVSEACANVIEHGYDSQPGHSLSVACRPTEQGLEVCIRDQGKPFDLSAVPHLPPDALREGGRGVFLIRQLMDEVSSSSDGAGNELRLFKRRRAP